MKLLVTGGAGYIGSVVAKQLLDAGHDVAVLDDLSRGHAGAVPAGAAHIEVGLLDAEGVRDALSAGLRRGAALRRARRSWRSPSSTRSATGATTSSARSTCSTRCATARRAAARLLLDRRDLRRAGAHPDRARTSRPTPSTRTATRSWRSTGCSPTSAARTGSPAASLRYFNVAGARGELGEDHEPETHLIPLVLQAAAGRRDARQRLRHGLSDARRHRRARLHPRGGPRPRAPARARRDPPGRAPHLQPRHRARATPCARWSTPRGASRGGRSPRARSRAGPATRRSSWPPRSGRARGSGWTPERGLEDMIADAWAWHQAHPDGYAD